MKRFVISPNILFTVGTIVALNVILVYGQMRDDCIKDQSATNADFIVETDSQCGGNKEVPVYGKFGKTRNDGSYVIQGSQQECYRDYNCEWIENGDGVNGYVNETVHGMNGDYIISTHVTWKQYQCQVDEETTSIPITDWTWYDSDWSECHPINEM
ncbi:MAG: hypothetical protein LBJ67_03445 [Planctomycetaceae bacterium]|jgi:hypothetical protein|nr:hypothetical protein [Planctomycetaceae bacterium]